MDRNELREILQQLKQPLDPKVHEVRELPGASKKWVFLKWQDIRERLDEVVPDWVIDYSDIQYIDNQAICRCAITILGIRKEAIACVPISAKSSNNKEMTRGSAADRVAAEGLKNAAEAWGVGRYLDNQEFTINYLWDNRLHLTDEMRQELQRLIQQYKLDTGIIKPKEAVRIAEPSTVNKGELFKAINGQLGRLGWTGARESEYLSQQFGKVRYQMSESELQQYLTSLQQMKAA